MKKLLLSAAILCGLSCAPVYAQEEVTYQNVVYTVVDGTNVEASWPDEEDPADWTVSNLVIPATFSDGNKTYTVIGVGGGSDGAFEDCISLRTVSLPNTITYIKEKAFLGCSALTSVTFAEGTAGLTTIGSYAFGETAISSLDIPEGLTTLETHAFANMGQVTEITLPSTLTKIGENIFEGNFDGTYKLSKVTCKAVTPPVCDITSSYTIPASCTLFVPKNSEAAYKAANEWKNFATIQMMPGTGTSVEEIEADVEIQAVNGNITVNAPFAVYTLDGKKIYDGEATTLAADKGIYLVITNGKSIKVAL